METTTTFKKQSQRELNLRAASRRALNAGILRVARIVEKHFRNTAALVLFNLSKFIRKQEDQLTQRAILTLSVTGFEAEIARFSEELLQTEITEAEIFGQLNFVGSTGEQMTGTTLSIFKAETSAFMNNIVPDAVDSIDRTTRNNIRGIIRRGFENDLSASEVVRDLQDRFIKMGDQARARSGRVFTIARTETGRAWSFGTLRSGILAGDQTKRWIWSGVERDFHASISGQTVPIGEDFTTGLGNRGPAPRMIGIAEEDINCQCIMITQPAAPQITLS